MGRMSPAEWGPRAEDWRCTRSVQTAVDARARLVHWSLLTENIALSAPVTCAVPTLTVDDPALRMYNGTGVAAAGTPKGGQVIEVDATMTCLGCDSPIWIWPNSAGSRPPQCCSYNRLRREIAPPLAKAISRTSNQPRVGPHAWLLRVTFRTGWAADAES